MPAAEPEAGKNQREKGLKETINEGDVGFSEITAVADGMWLYFRNTACQGDGCEYKNHRRDLYSSVQN